MNSSTSTKSNLIDKDTISISSSSISVDPSSSSTHTINSRPRFNPIPTSLYSTTSNSDSTEITSNDDSDSQTTQKHPSTSLSSGKRKRDQQQHHHHQQSSSSNQIDTQSSSHNQDSSRITIGTRKEWKGKGLGMQADIDSASSTTDENVETTHSGRNPTLVRLAWNPNTDGNGNGMEESGDRGDLTPRKSRERSHRFGGNRHHLASDSNPQDLQSTFIRQSRFQANDGNASQSHERLRFGNGESSRERETLDSSPDDEFLDYPTSNPNTRRNLSTTTTSSSSNSSGLKINDARERKRNPEDSISRIDNSFQNPSNSISDSSRRKDKSSRGRMIHSSPSKRNPNGPERNRSDVEDLRFIHSSPTLTSTSLKNHHPHDDDNEIESQDNVSDQDLEVGFGNQPRFRRQQHQEEDRDRDQNQNSETSNNDANSNLRDSMNRNPNIPNSSSKPNRSIASIFETFERNQRRVKGNEMKRFERHRTIKRSINDDHDHTIKSSDSFPSSSTRKLDGGSKPTRSSPFSSPSKYTLKEVLERSQRLDDLNSSPSKNQKGKGKEKDTSEGSGLGNGELGVENLKFERKSSKLVKNGDEDFKFGSNDASQERATFLPNSDSRTRSSRNDLDHLQDEREWSHVHQVGNESQSKRERDIERLTKLRGKRERKDLDSTLDEQDSLVENTLEEAKRVPLPSSDPPTTREPSKSPSSSPEKMISNLDLPPIPSSFLNSTPNFSPRLPQHSRSFEKSRGRVEIGGINDEIQVERVRIPTPTQIGNENNRGHLSPNFTFGSPASGSSGFSFPKSPDPGSERASPNSPNQNHRRQRGQVISVAARFPTFGQDAEAELKKKIEGALNGKEESTSVNDIANSSHKPADNRGESKDKDEDDDHLRAEDQTINRKVRFSPNFDFRSDSGSGEWSDLGGRNEKENVNNLQETNQIDLDKLNTLQEDDEEEIPRLDSFQGTPIRNGQPLEPPTPKPPGAYFSPVNRQTSIHRVKVGKSKLQFSASSPDNSRPSNQPKSPPLIGIPPLPSLRSSINSPSHSRSSSFSRSFDSNPLARSHANGNTSLNLGTLEENEEEEEEEPEQLSLDQPRESTPPRNSSSFSATPPQKMAGLDFNPKLRLGDFEASSSSLNLVPPGGYRSPSLHKLKIRSRSSVSTSSPHPLSEVSSNAIVKASDETRAELERDVSIEFTKALSRDESLRSSVETYLAGLKAIEHRETDNRAKGTFWESSTTSNQVSGQVETTSWLDSKIGHVFSSNPLGKSLVTSQVSNNQDSAMAKQQNQISVQLKNQMENLLDSMIYSKNLEEPSGPDSSSCNRRNVLLFASVQSILILLMFWYANHKSEEMFRNIYYDPFQPSLYYPTSTYPIIPSNSIFHSITFFKESYSFPYDWDSQQDLFFGFGTNTIQGNYQGLTKDFLRRIRQDERILKLTGDPMRFSNSVYSLIVRPFGYFFDLPFKGFDLLTKRER